MKINIRSFFGRLMTAQLIIILISLVVIGIIFGYLIQNYYSGLKEWKATNKGRRIARLVSNKVSGVNLYSNELEKARSQIATIAQSANLDIGIMNNQGTIIFHHTNLESFELTLADKEVERILTGNSITKKIRGPKSKNLLMGFPLLQKKDSARSIIMGPDTPAGKQIIGGIIVRSRLGEVTETIHEIIRLILYSFLVALAAALGVSFFFARRVTRPLDRINEAALQITEGKFKKVRDPQNSSQEIEHLVETFNYAVDQIDQTLNKKEKLEQMRKQFVADVSHEFRAPLTSIKGFLEILLDQELNRKERTEYLTIMYKDVEYLEHLLEDLVTLGQLESESIELERTEIKPLSIINRAVESLKAKFNKQDITLQTEIPAQLPVLYVDANRLHQVMINLLDNAVTYSPLGGEIKIKVKYTAQPEKQLQFSVIDQGPGIPADDLEKIWQRFYKIDDSRSRQDEEGSGLGLAIVKDIINKHGGSVEAKNKAQGAEISFILNQDSII